MLRKITIEIRRELRNRHSKRITSDNNPFSYRHLDSDRTFDRAPEEARSRLVDIAAGSNLAAGRLVVLVVGKMVVLVVGKMVVPVADMVLDRRCKKDIVALMVASLALVYRMRMAAALVVFLYDQRSYRSVLLQASYHKQAVVQSPVHKLAVQFAKRLP